MGTEKTDIQELSEFIRDNMLTRGEFREEIEKVHADIDNVRAEIDKLNVRLQAVESKIDGTNRRLDVEAMQRTDEKLPTRIAAIERHLGIDKQIAA